MVEAGDYFWSASTCRRFGLARLDAQFLQQLRRKDGRDGSRPTVVSSPITISAGCTKPKIYASNGGRDYEAHLDVERLAGVGNRVVGSDYASHP
jgi:hypothetical protein